MSHSRVPTASACLIACCMWAGAVLGQEAAERQGALGDAQLRQLGFATGEARVRASDYVRLRVAVFLPEEETFFPGVACPESLWAFRLKDLVAKNKRLDVGVDIRMPGIPDPVALTALSYVQVPGLAWGKQCDFNLHAFGFSSPVYPVRRWEAQNFTVAPSYKDKRELNATLLGAAGELLSLAKLPVSIAGKSRDQLTDNLRTLTTDEARERWGKDFTIAEGPVQPPRRWVVQGVMPKHGGGPRGDLVILAQLVPVQSLVLHENGEPWNENEVLQTAFPARGLAADRTLGAYVKAQAASEIQNFLNASDRPTMALACANLHDKLASMDFSERDVGLVLWAVTRSRISEQRPAGEIDSLACFDSHRLRLADAGITLEGREVVANAKPATLEQMQFATQVNDAFAGFFRRAWPEAKVAADGLFAYPVAFADPESLRFPALATVEHSDSWFVGAAQAGGFPLLARIGCYAYFPATPETASLSADSYMLAVGQVPGDAVTGGGREVLVRADFAPGDAKGRARIKSMSLGSTVLGGQRLAMRLANHGRGSCAQEWQPALLFAP